MQDKLNQAIALVQAGDKEGAGRLLADVLQADPSNETAWLWLTKVVATDRQRIDCLERVLMINSNNQAARQALAMLRTKQAVETGLPKPAASAEEATGPGGASAAQTEIIEPQFEREEPARPAPQPEPGTVRPEPVAAPGVHPQPPDELSQPAGQPPTAASERTRRPAPTSSRRLVLVLLALLLIVVAAACAGLLLLLNRAPEGLVEGGMALDLSNRGLAAVSLEDVPAADLVTLDLSGNQLTELPAGIDRLYNLEMLFVKDNQLRALPPEIGRLTKLKWLILADNRLTALPPEIGQLASLEVLDVQGNQIRELPPEIGRLTNLRQLNLQRNPVREVPPEVTGLPHLQLIR